MNEQVNDKFEKQFFEKHDRCPNDDEIMQWVISVIDQYREEDAFADISKLITRDYSDCVSEVYLIGNRWDEGNKYIIAATSLSFEDSRFSELSEKIKEIFGTRPTHVITQDYYNENRYYLEIYDDLENAKKIYPTEHKLSNG
ncbi:MAG: hypothetical protein IK990_02280 [Ruminiclostridium sp.]|nr:hypothetical protein [Ruminiclostridium sp.]